jgi:hypothetical protein
MAKSQSSFVWEDPLLLDNQLNEEERMLHDGVSAACLTWLLKQMFNSFVSHGFLL